VSKLSVDFSRPFYFGNFFWTNLSNWTWKNWWNI